MTSESGASQLREGDHGHRWSRLFKFLLFGILGQFLVQLSVAIGRYVPDWVLGGLWVVYAVLFAIGFVAVARNWWTWLDETPMSTSKREGTILVISLLAVALLAAYNFTNHHVR
jgi:hypothetical protein